LRELSLAREHSTLPAFAAQPTASSLLRGAG
jgi:hypothetical protein